MDASREGWHRGAGTVILWTSTKRILMREKREVSTAGRFSPKQPNSAFTRADLLATLAATTIMAFLAFRSIASSRSTSEIQICFNNLGQLTRAWTLFSEDNSG